MWGTVDDLKAKLGIADTSRDAALELVLSSATDKIADLTRYLETSETARQDLFRNVQVDTLLRLTKRPIDQGTTPVLVEGRFLSSDNGWFTLTVDVIDEDKGEFLILGRDAWWPPILIARPPYKRWRNIIWPNVRVTYDVTGQGSGAEAPKRLQDAAEALATYWYDRHIAGAAEDVAIGPLSKSIMDDPIPSWVLGEIAQDRQGESAGWV